MCDLVSVCERERVSVCMCVCVCVCVCGKCVGKDISHCVNTDHVMLDEKIVCKFVSNANFSTSKRLLVQERKKPKSAVLESLQQAQCISNIYWLVVRSIKQL